MAEGAHGGGGTPHNPSVMAVLVDQVLPGDVHAVPPYMEAIGLSIVVAAGMAIGGALLTRNMSRTNPSRRQSLVEFIVEALDNFVETMVGHGGRKYLPLVGTLFLYIFLMNFLGLLPGFMAPTSSASVTAGLAISVFLFVQYQGIRANGIGGYIRHFMGEPIWLAPLNIPLHVVGELARPVSLTLRLFGNIFGEELAIVILMGLGLVFFPIQFFVSTFAVFTSFVQAMVFSILTCVYIASATVHDHPEGEADHGHGVVETYTPAVPA